MLFDFVEPVCRACCNYEEIDKIKEVIENAKAVKSKFDVSSLPNGQKHELQPHSPLQPEPQPIRSPHEQLVSFLPAAATTMSINRTPAPSIATMPRQQAPPQTTCMVTSGPRPDMGKMHVVSPRDIATTKQHPGFPLPGALPRQTAFATHMHRVVPASHAATIPTSLLQNLIHHLSGPDHAKRFAQIQDTFNTLSKSPPFRVRYSKDHSLIGRVIAFDAVCRIELKVFIEYPIGSQTVFRSASGAGRQMYGHN